MSIPIRLSACLSLLGLFTLASAQEQQIVIEDLSRAELRAEIEKIENEFYRVFNASTEVDSLKVECRDYTPTGSRIKQRACEPRFLIDARAENVRDWQANIDDLASVEELQSELAPQFEELTAAMNALLVDSQYFRELNAILRMLRERQQELDGD